MAAGPAWDTVRVSDKPLPRPPQATFCGGTIIAGSVLVVLLAFGRMASLGTIEAQEEAQLFADSVGNGIGLTADDWQGVLRVLCVIAGGLGVVTAYLGWRVLQRDRSARIALSVLAPIALVAGIAVADFIPAILAVAVVLLWRSPTRDWFDGKVVPRPEPRSARPDPVAAAASARTTGSGDTAPTTPAAPATPGGAPVWPGAAAYPPPAGATTALRPAARPGTVLTAAVMTIVTSSVVLLALVGAMFFVAGDRASFESEVSDEMGSQQAYQDVDVDPAVIVDVFIGLLVVFAVWALVAIVLAVMTMRGSNGARITLVVSAIGAALASLIGVLVVVPLLVTAVCVAVAVLLLRRDAAAWFTTRPPS